MNKKLFSLTILGLLICISLQAQTSVAVLDFDNLNGDPKYDYLGGMLLGITLFDMASNNDITLINRSNLESVLNEQRLSLSGLIAGSPEMMEVGSLVGAQYLIKGEYVFLGTDLLVTVNVIRVKDGVTEVFRERGSGENMVHLINSKVLKYLTGKNVNLTGGLDRSLISLEDEKPGSIKLYTHIQQAEIFLDDEFAGYSTGDKNDPLILDNIKPGKHTVRLHLWEFGVFTDYTCKKFRDWEQEVDIVPGQSLIVRSDAYHISDLIRQIMNVAYSSVSFSDKTEQIEKSFETAFLDTNGVKIGIIVNMKAEKDGKNLKGEAVVNINGKDYNISVVSDNGMSKDQKEVFEILDATLSINSSFMTIDIKRNDVTFDELRQAMY